MAVLGDNTSGVTVDEGGGSGGSGGSGGTSGGTSGGGTDGLWKRTDWDCIYTFSGDVGAKIAIFGGTILTIGADGTATYTYEGGKTDCESGGRQQCTARYCPPISCM
jgi:hypothetical protein